MPFTPLHLGPALYLGVVFRRSLHLPTLLVASVAVDVEPLLVLLLGLDAPLHGPLHTFMGATAVGVVVALLMYLIDARLYPLYRLFRLDVGGFLRPTLGSHVASGIAGTTSHILLDAPLYYDMTPLYPVPVNPFYFSDCSEAAFAILWAVCIYLGVAGLVGYLRHSFGRRAALALAAFAIGLFYLIVFRGTWMLPFALLAVGVIAVNAWLIFKPGGALTIASVPLASAGAFYMALATNYGIPCLGALNAVHMSILLFSITSAQIFAASPLRIAPPQRGADRHKSA